MLVYIREMKARASVPLLPGVVFAVSLLCAAPAFPCIWSYGTNLHGKKLEVNGAGGIDLVVSVLGQSSYIDWKQQRRMYAERAAHTSDYTVRNDYAVSLLHVGETREAIRILRDIEAQKPGLYATAVNLGTALELAGRNDEALHWIREGIRRNPSAHDGTEWLHARILEAKIGSERNAEWMANNSVLGVDFGRDPVPRQLVGWPTDNVGRKTTNKALQDALYYQLNERLQFVVPPDAAVANLFFDWGSIVMLTGTLETSQELYLQALRFGAPNAPLVRARLAHVQQLLAKYKSKAK